MNAFDTIDESTSAHAVAEEWLQDDPSLAVDAPPLDLVTPFEDNLHRVASCQTELQNSISRGDATAYAAAGRALGEALRQVAAVEVRLNHLLALQGARALVVLEALQTYLDLIPEEHPRRRGAIHLLIKLAHRSGQFPQSLHVHGVVVPPDATRRLGGFADVYRGILAGRPVAVKRPRTLAEEPFALERLCREALVWRQLRHQNILVFLGLNYTVCPDTNLPALISSWMENGSLRDHVKRPYYNPEQEIPHLIIGIAEGTVYLHSLAITHGDIKPLNILIDQRGQPRLADFGLVRLGESITAGGFTQTTNGFDLRWSSPQRLEDDERCMPDDVYSFGCVCYYLYSGLVPFQGTPDAKAAMRILRGHRPDRPSFHNQCVLEPKDDMWNMITRCWSDERTARPTMASVCQELGARPMRLDYVEGLLQGHKDCVTSVAFSPDGSMIVSGSEDGTVIVWDAYSGNRVHAFHGHENIVLAVAFSLDGTRVLSCCSKAVTIWDTHADALMHKHELDTGKDIFLCAAFSTNGAQIATGTVFGTVRVFDAQSGIIMLQLHGHRSGVRYVAFSPNGAHIASGSFDHTIRIWDGQSGAQVHCIAHGSWVLSVAFSPDSTRIVSGSADYTAKEWDAGSGTLIGILAGHHSFVNSVAFSPDGTRIVVGFADGIVFVWDAETGVAVYKPQARTREVTSVAFSPDGTHIVTGSRDKTVGIWKIKS